MTNEKRSADPLVEEIRAIRDEHARRFSYDVEAILEDLRAFEKAQNLKTVSLPAKPAMKGTG